MLHRESSSRTPVFQTTDFRRSLSLLATPTKGQTKPSRFELKMETKQHSFTVGQDIFADMIFSRISRILTKPRKYHVREYDFNDFVTKKAY